MSPRLLAAMIGLVWFVTILLLWQHLGCSTTNPC